MPEPDIFRPTGLRHGYRALLTPAGVPGIYEAGDQWAGSDWAIGAHSHQSWELFLQLTDEPSCWDVAGTSHRVGKLQMLAVPPETRHELLSPRPSRWHFYYAALDPDILLHDFPDALAVWRAGLPVWFGDASACREPFEAFLREVASAGLLRPDALRATAAHLLIAAGRVAHPEHAAAARQPAASARAGTHACIARAQAMLQTRYDEAMTVDRIAQQVGLSTAYFTTLFTRETGMSPASFRRSVRLRHAQRLLQETDMSVAEVAATVGFSSGQHLATAMRSTLGCTPSDLRAAAS